MRFISLDDISYLEYDVLGGLNLWTYCNNNPIMYVDPDGEFAILTALLIGAGIGALFGGITEGISGYASGDRGLDLFGDIFGGALVGGALGLATVAGGLVGVGAVSGLGALGLFTGTTMLTFGAGIASYSIRYAGKESFSKTDMFSYAGKVTINSVFNFAMGYFLGKIGAWDNIGDKSFSKFKSDIIQNVSTKYPIINTFGLYVKEFALEIVARGIISKGIWWLLNELWGN